MKCRAREVWVAWGRGTTAGGSPSLVVAVGGGSLAASGRYLAIVGGTAAPCHWCHPCQCSLSLLGVDHHLLAQLDLSSILALPCRDHVCLSNPDR
jgi:hypothetical protein